MTTTMTAALVAMMCVGVVWADRPNVVIIYGDDVGIGQGSVRLHGGWPCLFRCARFRKKCSFTDNMIKAVEKPIDGLKPEIGHAHVIAIGINQGNADSGVPRFSDGSDLGFN